MGAGLKVGWDLDASDLLKLTGKESDGKFVARLLAIAAALSGRTPSQAANKREYGKLG